MLVLAAACATGCSDLSATAGSYTGRIVGTDDECEPPGMPCSFIRRGFPAGTGLTVRFAPPGSDGSAGTITTSPDYDAFLETPLLVIAPLEHDQLSLYDFPGGGRIQNYIFATRPTAGALAGHRPLVFVSLMDADRMEVRIISGSGDEAEGDHFGLFRLEKQ